MKKILFSLFILLAVNSQAQFVYPTETVWDFLSGLQTNRINSSTSSRLGINVAPLQDFHVLADTVRFEGLDGTGGFLTVDANGVVNKGVAALTGLTATQILFGSAGGGVSQSSHLTFNDATEVMVFGDATEASALFQVLSSDFSSILLSGGAGGFGITYQNSATKFYISNGSNTFSMTNGGRIGVRQVTPLQDVHILADTIRFEGLDGTGTYLGIDVNGDVTRTTVTGFGDVYKVGTPVNNQIGVWTGDGTIEGEASLTYDATASALTIDGANSGINVTGSATSEVRLNNTSATDYIIINNASGDLLIENTNANVGSPFIYTRASERIGLRQTTPLQDFHLLADTIRFEGLDGTGNYLGIDVNGDVTRTTVTGFGDVYKVGTPVNNQIGVWTGDGTIEGEASLTYDATAGFDLANSFDAQWSTTGSGTLITGNLSNASATGKLINLQHDEVTKFQVTYTGSTVIGKTSVDAVHALKAGQLGVGATGDVFQMANASGNTTTFTVDGKIDLYATEVPANGEILIGDGTDMELATITAGTGITITNAAGSITIAETNETSGEYTPTLASVTNVASTTTAYAHYYREGNYVHVFVTTTAGATTGSALTEMSVTLPIASNFTASTDGFGDGNVSSTANGLAFGGRVYADAANDYVIFSWRPTNTTVLAVNFSFSYKIL